ncbi:MAG: uridine kinase [Oscillospiraceae bacterium]|nr:uridine kinase [Oscillospiraceae bacterium]
MKELFSRIEQLGRGIVAIEGGSAAGKTTLASRLAQKYGCTVVHMDDFFLPLSRRTGDGNIDRARFLEQVLLPLSRGEAFDYIRFDCKQQTYCAPIRISPTPLVLVEGAYSMHPDFAGYYDFSVFLSVSKEVQTARVQQRPNAKDFFAKWIPMEEAYFQTFDIQNGCDFRI